MYSRILSTGSYLPEKTLTNKDLESMVDTTDEWIMKRVGVKKRQILQSNETTSSMAVNAAKQALEASGCEPNDIDMVVCATVTAEYTFPSVACIIQRELGITNESPAFDVSAACAGFIFAMNIVDQYIKSGAIKRALVIGVEGLSKIVDWNDRATCVLFGDGAGAVVLEANETSGMLASTIHSDGQYVDMLYAKDARWVAAKDAFIQMDGGDTFKLAVKKLGEIVGQTLDKAGVLQQDIDWLIPHQANTRIITAIAKRLDLSMDRVVMTIEDHGNTSSASVPLALDHALKAGNIQRGDLLMLEAFGGGLAWGASLIRY